MLVPFYLKELLQLGYMRFWYQWTIWAEMSGRPLVMGKAKEEASAGGSHGIRWNCLKQQKIQSHTISKGFYRNDNSYCIYTFIGKTLKIYIFLPSLQSLRGAKSIAVIISLCTDDNYGLLIFHIPLLLSLFSPPTQFTENFI